MLDGVADCAVYELNCMIYFVSLQCNAFFRRAEEQRVRALKELGDDHHRDDSNNNGNSRGSSERGQLLLLFAEERRRASDRIIQLTKEHENQIRNAVVAMVSN